MGTRVRDVVLVVAVGLALGASPAFAQAPKPPPPQVEKPTPSPGSQYVWIAGHWAWKDGAYVWVPGYWTEAQGKAWIPGRHEQTPQGWRYREGRWTK